jgi:hypothetical protein
VRLQIDLQNSGKAKYYHSRNIGLKYWIISLYFSTEENFTIALVI